MTLSYGSVCSGIEAATAAWHPLGFRAHWLAEIEPFPSSVLAHHYPEVPNLGDMTKLGALVLAGKIAAPDILVGGTPCQAFSVAGMREGLADPRGALTIKYVELADAIDHVRARDGRPPCVTVWENVPGVLSDKGNAFGCFLGALAGEDSELQPSGKKWTDAGCVYGPTRAIAWRILDAQYFGLAQRRRRVFVVASALAGFDPASVLFEREGVRRDSPPGRDEKTGTTIGTLGGTSPGGGWRFGADEAAAGQLIPAVAKTITAGSMGADREDCMNLIAGTLQSGGKAAGSATLQDAESGLLLAFGGGANCQATDVSTALSAHPGGTRMDAETETFIVHGTQDPGVSKNTAFALGRNNGGENAVCITGEVTHTLKADGFDGFDGSEDGTGRGQPITPGAAGVRRLTPRECERLQGFPDDYTLIPWRGKPAGDCPDGPRYKAIGNSKAVPVVRWIGRRIQQALE